MTITQSTSNPTRKPLVTGATSGIGRAAALRLARDGFHVVVHGRDAPRGAEVVGEIERAGGRATNVGSMAGQVGLAGGAAYSATKGALESLTRAWAAEFSPQGVRVNLVAPGPVFTSVPAERTEALGATTLFKRAAQADEIAGAISFLASPDSSYVTGAILAADAGRTAI